MAIISTLALSSKCNYSSISVLQNKQSTGKDSKYSKDKRLQFWRAWGSRTQSTFLKRLNRWKTCKTIQREPKTLFDSSICSTRPRFRPNSGIYAARRSRKQSLKSSQMRLRTTFAALKTHWLSWRISCWALWAWKSLVWRRTCIKSWPTIPSSYPSWPTSRREIFFHTKGMVCPQVSIQTLKRSFKGSSESSTKAFRVSRWHGLASKSLSSAFQTRPKRTASSRSRTSKASRRQTKRLARRPVKNKRLSSRLTKVSRSSVTRASTWAMKDCEWWSRIKMMITRWQKSNLVERDVLSCAPWSLTGSTQWRRAFSASIPFSSQTDAPSFSQAIMAKFSTLRRRLITRGHT